MASFVGIAAAALSLERLLNRAFQDSEPVELQNTKAVLFRTEDFAPAAGAAVIQRPVLSVFLYRIEFNKTTRAAWSGAGAQRGLAHAPLDLHFLLSPWASNAEDELRILGRTVQCLEATPSLSGPLLHPDGGWGANEAVQLVPEELSVEAVMRTFESLPTDYRPSLAYIARVVRLDSRSTEPLRAVGAVVTGAAPEVSG